MSSAPAASPLMAVHGLVKQFPGVKALKGVDLALYPGEVVAIIGENGAGKSTLMKILAGVASPDSGSIEMDGAPVRIDSVHDALRLGISLIHQELNLADNLSVGANLFLGREPRRLGIVRRAQIRREAKRLLDQVGLAVDPDTLVRELSIGHQQMVEIAKALSTNARVLIMDEPTSSLSQHETEQLFRVIRELRGRGVCIVYISHRLGEVMALADRVFVMRDGEHAGDLARQQITHDAMVKLMVGRDLSQFYARQSHVPGTPLLEVRELRTAAHPRHPISLTVRSGEIVGLAGLVGAGRSELLRVLFGIDPARGGEIRVAGRPVSFRSPIDAIRAGVALVPEDRKLQGLVLEFAVRQNISLASLRRHRRPLGFLNFGVEERDSRTMIRKLNVKTPHDGQIVQYLSGGNQQKVVLGKWLALQPQVLLLDEPTRGVDVGAKQEIYSLMDRLAGDGVAVLFASSEMEEILGMSDRTLVMHEGRITGELARNELSEESVMQLATGKCR